MKIDRCIIYDAKEFLTDENRIALRRFLQRYAKDPEDVLTDGYLDMVIQMLTDDANGKMLVSDFNKRIKALTKNPDSEFRYAGAVSAMRHCDLFYCERWDKDARITTNIFMQSADLPAKETQEMRGWKKVTGAPESETRYLPDNLISPLYSRKCLTEIPELEGLKPDRMPLDCSLDYVEGPGSFYFVINPSDGKDNYVFSLGTVSAYFGWMEDLSSHVSHVLNRGIWQEDIFPLMKIMFSYKAVECVLADGTYLKGFYVPFDNEDPEAFTLLPVDDRYNPIENEECTDDKVIPYSSIRLIRLALDLDIESREYRRQLDDMEEEDKMGFMTDDLKYVRKSFYVRPPKYVTDDDYDDDTY
ncbi:MAG: hypothetical protein LUE27_08200 [Clostridia bacterium]|nr:hypothetical protein [Clostridia bacterium]